MANRSKSRAARSRRAKRRAKVRAPSLLRTLRAIRRWSGWNVIFFLCALVVVVAVSYLAATIAFRAYFGVFLMDFELSGLSVAMLAVSSAILLFLVARAGWPEPPTTTPIEGKWAKARKVFIWIFAVITLNVLNLFFVTPWVLHQAIAVPHLTVATVNEKQPGGYRECSWQVYIREFDNAFFCATAGFYQVIQPGQLIWLKGRISPFGMSVSQYMWVVVDPETEAVVGQHEPIPVWR